MFLHNGDYTPTITFEDSECHKEWVYVDGLDNGMYLSSDNPYLLQKDNGVIVSLDHSFDHVNLHDKDGVFIETIDLNFKTECVHPEKQFMMTDNSISINESTHSNQLYLIVSLFVILLVGLIVLRFLKQND